MEFPDLKTLDPAALRALRVTYLQLMDGHRRGEHAKDAPIYNECVSRKNAINEELRSRGENITATGLSTPESRAKMQKLGVSFDMQEINAELKAKDAEIERLKQLAGVQ